MISKYTVLEFTNIHGALGKNGFNMDRIGEPLLHHVVIHPCQHPENQSQHREFNKHLQVNLKGCTIFTTRSKGHIPHLSRKFPNCLLLIISIPASCVRKGFISLWWIKIYIWPILKIESPTSNILCAKFVNFITIDSVVCRKYNL